MAEKARRRQEKGGGSDSSFSTLSLPRRPELRFHSTHRPLDAGAAVLQEWKKK
jgi:hypothetical protein